MHTSRKGESPRERGRAEREQALVKSVPALQRTVYRVQGRQGGKHDQVPEEQQKLREIAERREVMDIQRMRGWRRGHYGEQVQEREWARVERQIDAAMIQRARPRHRQNLGHDEVEQHMVRLMDKPQ